MRRLLADILVLAVAAGCGAFPPSAPPAPSTPSTSFSVPARGDIELAAVTAPGWPPRRHRSPVSHRCNVVANRRPAAPRS